MKLYSSTFYTLMLASIGVCCWTDATAQVQPPANTGTPVWDSARAGVPANIVQAPPGDLQLGEVLRAPEAHAGATVRWGGTITALHNGPGGTRLDVRQHGLDQNGRPDPSSPSAGSFSTRVPGIPYDPAVYGPGREITVLGILQGTIANGPGPSQSPALPLVNAKDYFLWGRSASAGEGYKALFQPRPRYWYAPGYWGGGRPYYLPYPSVGAGYGFRRGWWGPALNLNWPVYGPYW